MTPPKMKIGLLGHDFVNWGGGVDFLRMVTDSLLAAPRAEHAEFHMLIPDAGPRLAWRGFRQQLKQTVRALSSGKKPPSKNNPSANFASGNFEEFSSRITIRHIDIGRRALLRSAQKLKLDVLIPAVHSLKDNFPFPWVAYAYDFQHKYYPQYFTPDDCRLRDKHFSSLLTQAKAVLANSHTTAADIAEFVPEATARVFTLPYAPAPSPDWLEERPESLSRWDITPPFFLISNQFWAHKAHDTAFEAFRSVAAHNPAVTLICTGSTSGATNPEYFPGLMHKLKSWDLEKRVRILGLIPKRDQIEIMKQACAVIQPTLYEGDPGGGSVCDAVCLGVPVIMSDIRVNREYNGPGATFFPVGNAEALAEKMENQLLAPRIKLSAAELFSSGRRRRAACGEVLWSAIDYVV